MAFKRRNILKPARLRPSITPGTVRGRPGWASSKRLAIAARITRGYAAGHRVVFRPLS